MDLGCVDAKGNHFFVDTQDVDALLCVSTDILCQNIFSITHPISSHSLHEYTL